MYTIPTLQAISRIHDKIASTPAGTTYHADRGYCSIRHKDTDIYAFDVHPVKVILEKEKDGSISISIGPNSSHSWTDSPTYDANTSIVPSTEADMIKRMYAWAEHAHGADSQSFTSHYPEFATIGDVEFDIGSQDINNP